MPFSVDLAGTSVLLLRPGFEVTDEELANCARLFSENYGVWGPHVKPPLQPGAFSMDQFSSKSMR